MCAAAVRAVMADLEGKERRTPHRAGSSGALGGSGWSVRGSPAERLEVGTLLRVAGQFCDLPPREFFETRLSIHTPRTFPC